MLNHSCIPELNLSWSWYMIFLIYRWSWFDNIENFCIHICYWCVYVLLLILASKILFAWFLCNFLIFVGILLQDDAGIVEWVGSVPSSVIIRDSLRRIGVNSALNIWYNSPLKPSGPGLLYLGRFFKKVFIYGCTESLLLSSGFL